MRPSLYRAAPSERISLTVNTHTYELHMYWWVKENGSWWRRRRRWRKTICVFVLIQLSNSKNTKMLCGAYVANRSRFSEFAFWLFRKGKFYNFFFFYFSLLFGFVLIKASLEGCNFMFMYLYGRAYTFWKHKKKSLSWWVLFSI